MLRRIFFVSKLTSDQTTSQPVKHFKVEETEELSIKKRRMKTDVASAIKKGIQIKNAKAPVGYASK